MLADGEGARKNRRFLFLNTIQYRLDREADNQIVFGTGVDISESGMSIYTSCPLKEGQGIVIGSKLPVERRKAKVKWVTACGTNFYRVGLVFTE